MAHRLGLVARNYPPTMDTRRHARIWLKWGGLAAIVIMIATCAANYACDCWFNAGRLGFSNYDGAVQLTWWGHLSGPSTWIGGLRWSPKGVNLLRRPDLTYTHGVVATIFIPLWFPLLLIVIPTTRIWFADIRARFRRRVGTCGRCGYDLQGLAAGSKCPECGTPATISAPVPPADGAG